MACCVPKPKVFVPKYPFAPCLSNKSELGAKGKVMGAPGVKSADVLVRVIGTTRVMQVCVVELHALEVT
jgi:hypothetical protein